MSPPLFELMGLAPTQGLWWLGTFISSYMTYFLATGCEFFLVDNMIFVFNEDCVDRGPWDLETLILLLAWKVYKIHLYAYL